MATPTGFPNMPNQSLWGFLHDLYKNRGSLSVLGANADNSWYVDPVNGNDARDGRTFGTSKLTLANVLSKCSAGAFIFVYPGQLAEGNLTIARSLSKVTIIGVGGRGAAYLEPTTEDQSGILVNADDVTMVNFGVAGEDADSAYAIRISGARFRAYGCKFEGADAGVQLLVGTVAEQAAGTNGTAADSLFSDCEIAWNDNGVILICSDYGAVTQARFERCLFHNNGASHFEEANGSGGAAGVRYRDLWIADCVFSDNEDGSAPTKFLSLNDDNANTGIVARCAFPTAINGGLNLVSTALHWVANYHTGGVSTAQPS